MNKRARLAFGGALALVLMLTGAFLFNGPPKGILYEASQDPAHEAYHWSIHELLLTPGPDMESILADYEAKYEEYVLHYQQAYDDEESLQSMRPPWQGAVGENGCRGYVSTVDMEWPGWWISLEEALEMVEPYQGQFRAIPVFAPDFSEIVGYFLMGIG